MVKIKIILKNVVKNKTSFQDALSPWVVVVFSLIISFLTAVKFILSQSLGATWKLGGIGPRGHREGMLVHQDAHLLTVYQDLCHKPLSLIMSQQIEVGSPNSIFQKIYPEIWSIVSF